MTTTKPTLFDEVSASLPLFDELPEGAMERLAASGFGRGLLTASLRARLRKAGYADMGMLARATPADLTAVRKIGPVRVEAIRAHLLGELARLVPGARAAHDGGASDGRRLERLRAVPVGRLPLDAALVDRLGRAGGTCADLALKRRAEIVPALEIPAAEVGRIVAALARVLLPDRPCVPPAPAMPEDEAERAAQAERARAEALRDRDREWEEAAPARRLRPARAT